VRGLTVYPSCCTHCASLGCGLKGPQLACILE
jgi:hypothetical protein